MIVNEESKIAKRIDPNPGNYINPKLLNNELELKEQKEFKLVKEPQKNLNNELPKPNNETSSKFTSSPKPIKDIYNNLDDLKNFLQIESPQFLEKFELQKIIKSGSL